jgi:hypothetical protein
MAKMGVTPDLNQNGVSEIVLVGGSTNQGYTGSAIALYELQSGNLTYLGRTTTYSDNSGAVESDRVQATAYRISAQPSVNPTFLREIYEMRGNARSWTLIQKSEPFSLSQTDPDKFVKIR